MMNLNERDEGLMFLSYIEGRTAGVKSIGNLSKQGLICLISEELARREVTKEEGREVTKEEGRESKGKGNYIDIYF